MLILADYVTAVIGIAALFILITWIITRKNYDGPVGCLLLEKHKVSFTNINPRMSQSWKAYSLEILHNRTLVISGSRNWTDS